MFEYADFVLRNPLYATKNWRAQSSVRKNMLKYKMENAAAGCEWCGRRKSLDVHHRVPVSVDPLQADKTSNMALLCHKGCHLVVGHNRHYGGRFERKLDEVCEASEVVKITKGK